MKKYNVQNYIRYKEDLKTSMPEQKCYDEYTRHEMVLKFMPLVENIARKFSTSQQASGVMSINDLIQEGGIANMHYSIPSRSALIQSLCFHTFSYFQISQIKRHSNILVLFVNTLLIV